MGLTIAHAYLAYFSALYISALLWTYEYTGAALGVALTVVLLHFAFGGLTLWTSGTTFEARKRYAIARYTRTTNAFADLLLAVALGLLVAHAFDQREFLLFSGVGVATVGNSLCVLQHFPQASVNARPVAVEASQARPSWSLY